MSAVTLAREGRGHVSLKAVTLVLAGAITVALAIPSLQTGALDAMSNDDAMRLVEVRDLLAGQPWFDSTQHRLDPPGLPMHWSRVIDAPLAAIILALRPLFGSQGAETAVLFIWPMVLFATVLMLVAGIGRQMPARGDRTQTQFAALIAAALCAPALVHFRAGAIDHHNAQLVLLLGLLLSALQIQRSRAAAICAGICATLSLAIGLEMLPMIAAACLALFGLLVWRGRTVAPQVGIFGATLAVSSALLAAMLLRPATLADEVFDAFGGPVLLLIFGGGLCLVIVAATSRRWSSFAARGIAGCLAGATVLSLFLYLFPGAVASPYASVDPLVATFWLNRVSETMSIQMLLLLEPQQSAAYYLFPAVTLVLAAFATKRAGPDERFQWCLAIAVLAAAFIVTLWQLRGAAAASLVAAPLFPVSLVRLWPALQQGRRALLITLLASPACLAAAGSVARPLIDQVLKPQWTIARQTSAAKCSTVSGMSPLAQLPAGRVMAPIDLGPAILAASGHSIYAAPYHRNNSGNLAMLRSLMAPAAEARQMLQRHQASYVVLCRGSLELMELERDAPDGVAARLERGQALDFLEPVELRPAGPLAVWRVR